MTDPLNVSFNKVRTSAVDLYNDLFHRNINKTQQNNKKIELGNYLNGQLSYGGVQTAAANWDE